MGRVCKDLSVLSSLQREHSRRIPFMSFHFESVGPTLGFDYQTVSSRGPYRLVPEGADASHILSAESMGPPGKVTGEEICSLLKVNYWYKSNY